MMLFLYISSVLNFEQKVVGSLLRMDICVYVYIHYSVHRYIMIHHSIFDYMLLSVAYIWLIIYMYIHRKLFTLTFFFNEQSILFVFLIWYHIHLYIYINGIVNHLDMSNDRFFECRIVLWHTRFVENIIVRL